MCFTALHAFGMLWVAIGCQCQCDLLLLGGDFMNEFAPYAMQAPLLKRRTHQRFTEVDYSFHWCDVALPLRLACEMLN